MIAQKAPLAPAQKDTRKRKERRVEILQERRRVKKALKKMRRVTFDNDTVTEAGNFQFIKIFKDLINLNETIEQEFTLEQKGTNTLYSAHALIDYLLDCILLEHTRFSHMDALRHDPGYLKIKELLRFPDESTFRGFLAKLQPEHLTQLINIHKKLLHKKAKLEGEKRLIWIDIDDTVMTLFGEQEGSKNGYNPRYHGRPSYKARLAFISGSGELVHQEINPGNTSGLSSFLNFIKEVESTLPPEYIIEGIRADSGFADKEVMEYAEEQGWEYIIKFPKKETVKRAIAYLNNHPAYWETLEDKEEDIQFAQEDEHWAAADIPILLSTWTKARRCVIYRETHEPKAPQDTPDQLVLPLYTYTYQAIITNSELKPQALIRSYNKRANIENKIDEIKSGYALEQNSQHCMLRNQTFGWIKAIAYNIVVWFKQTLLPENLQSCEVQTIRRIVIKVPGNIVGQGRYQHIRLAPSPQLEKIVQEIQMRLMKFVTILAPPDIPSPQAA